MPQNGIYQSAHKVRKVRKAKATANTAKYAVIPRHSDTMAQRHHQMHHLHIDAGQ